MFQISRPDASSTLRLRSCLVALGLAFAVAACGSSEASSTEPGAAETGDSAPAEPTSNEADDAGEPLDGEELRDELTSGLDDEELAELDAGISGLDGDTRFGIVADQMPIPPAEISIEGNTVRFRFESGSVDENSFFDCTLIEVLAEEGEVIVVEYPDSEKEC